MKRFFLYLFISLLLINLNVYAKKIKRPYTKHEVYLKGTDYELHVYRIYGRIDGPTMLIIGGIQGDEPGGYLSADLYSDLILEKGNLIVVPRANLKSIILFNRGPDGDMNRLFQKKKIKTNMDKVVNILKKLMSECDVFLHLHDGWGFHYPKYINKLRNPKRFGQSIIVDADIYKCGSGKILNLKAIATRVLNRVNSKIKNKNYYLYYFNTKTNDKNTPFKDMKKTATFYALTHYCIPAFGIETSKNLPSLELKIRIHNYAVNEFMKAFGIVPEQPPVFLLKPVFEYAVINVNSHPQVIENSHILYLNKGDIIEVTHIESNYKRGLSCDIIGYGTVNDMHKKIKIISNTKIIFRKDNHKIGKIDIKINGKNHSKYFVFIIEVNGKQRAVLSGETLAVKKGTILKIVKGFADVCIDKDIKINFKGFVPPRGANKGDDRGFKILIDGNLLGKYSKNKEGKIYPVIATLNNQKIAEMFVEIIR